MNSETTTIGITVVEQDGCYLLGTRASKGSPPGYDEFPGGKCKPGETPKESAVRECREETGLDVTPIELLLKRTFTYPHGTVQLHFWRCRPECAVTLRGDYRGFRWMPAAELESLRFPEANGEVIAMLVAKSL